MPQRRSRAAQSLLVVCFCTVVGCLLATAGDFLSQGKRALAAGKYEEAARLLEIARDRSEGCEASYYLGLARYRLRHLDQAIIELQSASQCDENNPELRISMAAAYSEKGDMNRALAAFEDALRIKPDHVEALRGAAELNLRLEKNEKALASLQRLVEIEPNDTQARSDLGAAFAATGNLEKAREQFQQALQLQPNNASALEGLGNVHLKLGENEEAVSLLNRAAKADPSAYEPRARLAAAYIIQRRYANAVTECNEALRLGGTDPEIYYHLAKAYGGLGREEEARKALTRFSAMRAQSNNESGARREAAQLIEQAKPLVEEGNLSGAIALLEKGYPLDPTNPQLLFRLAGLYFDTRQYESALRYAQAAISAAPSEWLYHYLLGLIQKSSGELASAHKSLETAVRLNPLAADAFNQLGDLAMRGKDFEEAIRNFESAARLEPHVMAYRLNLQAAQRQCREHGLKGCTTGK